ncbi:MAG: hypothetical protein M0Z68_11075 [Gammaproteobacteria bacterium]|nr:hypothetical protein [Gammaproteobacteria bacterium]
MSLDDFNERKSPDFAFLVEQAARALNWQPVNRTMADACERDARDFHTAAGKIGVALTALGRGRKGAAGKAIRDALAALNNSGSPVGVWCRNPALYSLSGAPSARHKSQREADAWLATMSGPLARFVTVTLQEVGPQRFETPSDKLRAVRDFLKGGEALMRFHLKRARTEGNRRDVKGKGRQALEHNVKDALRYLAWAYREGTGREPGISPHAKGQDAFSGMVAAFCDAVGLDASQALRLADEHRAYVLAPAPQWEALPPTDSPWAPFETPAYRVKP